jgi:large subunit ribosomal protein L29
MPTKWIKEQKLRDLSVKELEARANELKASQFANRFQRSVGKLENYRVMPQTRQRLAAVLTVLREKQLTVAKKEGK